ncbi:MAG: response regulator transcription factor [Caldilineales bacterium]|nr:response regulator transcription factor [Caldilineales bacterium]
MAVNRDEVANMSNGARILVVDDEQPLREFISRNLAARGYAVTKAANGLEAMAIFQSEALDLIILDLMMPHMDGLETTQRIRRVSTLPIIVLSALDEERDKVMALNMGADDYLTKPFGVEELLARVRVALRRMRWTAQPAEEGVLHAGDITLDPEKGRVMRDGKEVKLTRTEFDLLHYLMQNPDRALSHRRILQNVWGPEYGNESEYLRVYIGRLRKKLEKDAANPAHLITEHGLGYRFAS